ncbi:helix-turn-helix transcriptional regulator [Frankia sp. AgB1.9]|uniref:helix-turn-helix domain-containing protein n=1 Tax=unclassified Frankia TaxID=2632575 RepID=UPI001931ED0B|nr:MULTISPECIES: helix-turn-helix transcriptional regulator [unclassified Frankia]MBL7491327.1 helix-turn-helix transcriptional regulator [Frankia sp. AgW1.1]MBL7546605.1 helix-turn-helix transcriptional regulator [Frankia sp. AgB1.9]MBL7624661.1 helix-turn-helix transcriptional regulator [Frankia sp. AgB1.8]
MELDDDHAARLASEVRKARIALRRSQHEAAAKGDISVATLGRIEQARSRTITDDTIVGLELAVDWQAGSVALVIAGGSPLPADHPRAVIRDLTDEQGRPYRRIEAIVDDSQLGEGAADRERWIEVWDLLAARDLGTARTVLRMAEAALSDATGDR